MQTLALVCRDWHVYAEQLYRRATPVDVVVTRKGFCVKRGDERSVNRTTPDPDVEIVRVKIKDWEEGHETGAAHRGVDAVCSRRGAVAHARGRTGTSPVKTPTNTMCGAKKPTTKKSTTGMIEMELSPIRVDTSAMRSAGSTEKRSNGGDDAADYEDDDIIENVDDESDDGDDDDLRGVVRGTRSLVQDGIQSRAASAVNFERRTVDQLDENDRLVGTLAKFCPEVEYIEGSGSSMGANLHGNWTCDLEVWTQFCRSCVSLREFDLQIVPFSDLYLSPFAATVKPQLRSLTIGYAEHENGIALRDLRVSPRVLASMFGNLPALEKLTFMCKGEPNGTLFELSTLLTDDLVVALVTDCPRLRRLVWRIMCGVFDAQPRLARFTDASLVALSTLPSFEHLDIPLVSTSCTHEDLLAFARSNRSTASRSRTLQFEIDHTGERGSVLAFLDRLLAEEEDLFAGPRLQILLKTTILKSQDDSNQLRARLAQRHVNAIFNRSYMLIGGEMPIRLVILGTSDGPIADY